MRNLKSFLSEQRARMGSHQGFRRYLANTSWLFAEQVARIVAGLFVGIYVARYLGPAEFGVFSYAVAFVALFGAIAKLGLDGVVVRDLVTHPNESGAYVGTAFWLKAVGALLSLALIALSLRFTGNGAQLNLYILIIAAGLLFQAFDAVDFYFQSKVLSRYASICKLAQLAASSFLKLYLIAVQAELFWFVLTSLVDQIFLGVTLWIAYRQQKVGSLFRFFDQRKAAAMLRTSWPLILSGIAVSLYMRIDQVMIKEMLGEREVGLYSAAVRLSEAWYFVPVVICNSLFPAIVNARRISDSLYQERLRRLSAVLSWTAIAIALFTSFTSERIITMLFGISFAGAGSTLAIHMWASLFVFFGVLTSKWLLVENLPRYSFLLTLIAALINIAMNLVLIPRYGIAGAALATLSAQAITTLLVLLILKRTRPLLYVFFRGLNFFGVLKWRKQIEA
ncbi:flippase [Thiobacillus sedimenti]|uniref:Flippase n=1 Tax=Thiobacillus sedimenti TaxID=3110231 RepID=A0ABZ1CHN4_9PROT|nr:flippase [Thiobacillus sp. SCUT-2]WRS38411.1 flippase [Thiobacillus sp. SCUT-2]